MSIYKNLKKTQTNNHIKATEAANLALVKKEILEENLYEKCFPVERGDVVLDIGAHVGVFTQKVMGIAEYVVAVEPDPLFYNQLTALVSEKVECLQMAIAARNGKSLIQSNGELNSIGKGDISINTISFASLVSSLKRVDFLKTDCEGGEYDIFNKKNMPWIAANCKKMVGELHIHNTQHRRKIQEMFRLFDKYRIRYFITSVDGVLISREYLQQHLDYYKEVIFYAVTPRWEGSFTYDPGPGRVIRNFYNGVYVQLKNTTQDYKVDISSRGTVYRSTVMGSGGWTHYFPRYYQPYTITVTDPNTGKEFYHEQVSLEGKKVLVELGSKALGDTLAWVPYAEEFRKKHRCNLKLVTYHNDLFLRSYPEIEFMEPGSVHHDIFARYIIGWYYQEDNNWHPHAHPSDPRSQPLQKTATDILGLDYQEVRPVLDFTPSRKPLKGKYICIANHSTLQAKYWNHPNGWQSVVDHLKTLGYKVVLLSREPDGHQGNFNPKGVLYPKDHQISTIMNYLHHTHMFIGIGSGLSWLAWALEKPVVLISGFSEDYTEMQDCIRINAPENICKGCFNWVRLQHDGDYNWCPRYKGTSRQFECTKNITPEMVIKAIGGLI